MHNHTAVLVHRRPWWSWFQRRYWVRCWHCSMQHGPYETEADGRLALDLYLRQSCPEALDARA